MCLVSLGSAGGLSSPLEGVPRHYSIASWVLAMCFMPPGKASRKWQCMVPLMPSKPCLVIMSWFFLLDQIHFGLVETDLLEPDAVFINTSEALFGNKFTSLEKNSLFLLV